MQEEDSSGRIRELEELEKESEESVLGLDTLEFQQRAKRNTQIMTRFSHEPVIMRHTSTTESDVVTLSPVHYRRESTSKDLKRRKGARIKKKSSKSPTLRKTEQDDNSVSDVSFERTTPPPRRIQTGILDSRLELRRVGELLSRSESPRKQKRDFPAQIRELSDG